MLVFAVQMYDSMVAAAMAAVLVPAVAMAADTMGAASNLADAITKATATAATADADVAACARVSAAVAMANVAAFLLPSPLRLLVPWLRAWHGYCHCH